MATFIGEEPFNRSIADFLPDVNSENLRISAARLRPKSPFLRLNFRLSSSSSLHSDNPYQSSGLTQGDVLEVGA